MLSNGTYKTAPYMECLAVMHGGLVYLPYKDLQSSAAYVQQFNAPSLWVMGSPIFLHGCKIKSGRGRPKFEATPVLR